MNEEFVNKMDEIEAQYSDEVKGYGSLMIHLVPGGGKEEEKLGFEIRPEDIEALFFDGIGIPRWESIEAESHDEQLKIYNESMKTIMADYPEINRVNDTDVKVEFGTEDLQQLQAECEKLLDDNSDPKVVKALQKYLIACHRALVAEFAMHLIPN